MSGRGREAHRRSGRGQEAHSEVQEAHPKVWEGSGVLPGRPGWSEDPSGGPGGVGWPTRRIGKVWEFHPVVREAHPAVYEVSRGQPDDPG